MGIYLSLVAPYFVKQLSILLSDVAWGLRVFRVCWPLPRRPRQVWTIPGLHPQSSSLLGLPLQPEPARNLLCDINCRLDGSLLCQTSYMSGHGNHVHGQGEKGNSNGADIQWFKVIIPFSDQCQFNVMNPEVTLIPKLGSSGIPLFCNAVSIQSLWSIHLSGILTN